jgi:hypothetical protein
MSEDHRTIVALYRISDRTDVTTRPEWATNERCLANFLHHWLPHVAALTVVADNVGDGTFAMVRTALDGALAKITGARPRVEIHRTTLGNCGSFDRCLTLALALPEATQPGALVYFAEDDYLYRDGCVRVLRDGLRRAHYATVYDHPDKYMARSPNPEVQGGGEVSRVLLGAECHWKTTNSTTYTFGARLETLRADADTMRRFLPAGSNRPLDFLMWMHLRDQDRRALISSMPAYATHGDSRVIAPLVDWDAVSAAAL